MFGHSFFGASFFGPEYFGPAGTSPIPPSYVTQQTARIVSVGRLMTR